MIKDHSPRVSAFELLAQIRDEYAEMPQHQIMLIRIFKLQSRNTSNTVEFSCQGMDWKITRDIVVSLESGCHDGYKA